jgi:hypothetical protein
LIGGTVLAKMRDAVTMLSFKLMMAKRFGIVPASTHNYRYLNRPLLWSVLG